MDTEVKEIKVNSFSEEQTDAMLTTGQTWRFNSFQEFINTVKTPTFHITDTSKIEQTPLKELWQDYDRCQWVYKEKIAEGEGIEKQISDIEAEMREVTKRIHNAKDDKGSLLSLLNGKDYLDATAERKTLTELNGLIETLGHRLEKVKTLKAELLEKRKAFTGEFGRLRDSLTFPEKYLLRGIAEDIKDQIVKRVSPELKALVVINRRVSGGINYKKIFDGLNFGEIDVESSIVEIIKGYEARFKKEGNND